MNKIKLLFNLLLDAVVESKKAFVTLLIIFPLVVLTVFLGLLEMSLNNVFFMTIFLSVHYIGAFALTLVLMRGINHRPLARSPFYFIKRFHFTYNKDYWDKDQQEPLKHLIGVEVGVYEGHNAQRILDFLNIKELVLVDPWRQYMDINTGVTKDDSFYEPMYQKIKIKFSNNPEVRIIRDTSLNAARMFSNEYFDFVYLDGDHGYDAVLADLEAWYPKLKEFGVMCGDDFGHISGHGVIKAVSEFAYKYKVLQHYGEDNQFWFVKI